MLAAAGNTAPLQHSPLNVQRTTLHTPKRCHSLTSIRYNKTAINVSGFGTDVPQYRKLPRAAPRATSPAQQFVAPSNSGTELDEVRTASSCIRLIACNFTTGKFGSYHLVVQLHVQELVLADAGSTTLRGAATVVLNLAALRYTFSIAYTYHVQHTSSRYTQNLTAVHNGDLSAQRECLSVGSRMSSDNKPLCRLQGRACTSPPRSSSSTVSHPASSALCHNWEKCPRCSLLAANRAGSGTWTRC